MMEINLLLKQLKEEPVTLYLQRIMIKVKVEYLNIVTQLLFLKNFQKLKEKIVVQQF
mgnify:CR=1 FL=1